MKDYKVFFVKKIFVAFIVSVLIRPSFVMADTNSVPARIVTAGSNVNALVYALGAGKDVIATGITSQGTPGIKKLPKIGYLRTLSTEGVLSVNPDYLIGSDEMGPAVTIQQLKQSGVQVLILSSQPKLSVLYDNIHQLGRALKRNHAASALIKKIKEEIAHAQHIHLVHPPRVLFVMLFNGGIQAFGADTVANEMISLAGGVNIMQSRFKGMRPLSAESLVMLKPDIILVSSASESVLSDQKIKQQISQVFPVFKATAAWQQQHVKVVDANQLVGGLGPETGVVVNQLAHYFQSARDDTAS